MAKKPASKKKPAAKKVPAKKVEVKVVQEITVFEQKVLDQVDVLLNDDCHITLECEGRNISIKKNTDVLNLVRTYEVLNLYGTKSGCPVRLLNIR